MIMRPFLSLPFILAISGLVLSAPAPGNDLMIRNIDECKAVTVIISVLSQYKASATSFCSSFISKTVTSVTARDLPLASKEERRHSLTATDRNLNSEAFDDYIHHHSHTEKVGLAPLIVQFVTIYTLSRRSIRATTTTTPTVILSIISTPAKRAITPDLAERDYNSPVPTYLTSFASSEISSACSCLSITPYTTTVKTTSTVVAPGPSIVVKTTSTAAPVTTTVSTLTVTASTTVTECANALPTFILKLKNSVVLDGVQLKGTYDQIDDGDGELVGFNGLTQPSAAGILSLTSAGFLMIDSVGQVGIRFPSQTGLQLLLFESPAEAKSNNATPVVCSVATGVLTCTDGVNSILQLCPGDAVTDDLFIGPVVVNGCVAVILEVLPVCVVP